MNLAEVTKCLKSHALNKKISDEVFFNELISTYSVVENINNKKNENLYFDKSRTSLILNRREDVPIALRKALNSSCLYAYMEDNFTEFIDEYINSDELNETIFEISNMIKSDDRIKDKDRLLNYKDVPNKFLTYVLVECIKLKNDGLDPKEEIVRNGEYCIKVVFKDIFKYSFRKRSKEKNIVVIPVDTKFRTHVTRKSGL